LFRIISWNDNTIRKGKYDSGGRMKKKRLLDRLSLCLFLLSILTVGFAYGVMVGKYRIFPHNWIETTYIRFRDRNPHHLFPAQYEYSGAKVHDAEAMAPGVTLLTSYWRSLDWKPGIRVIDADGKVLHEWKTDPAEIWPTSPHTDHRSGRLNTSGNYVHGCFLFDNGDVIFNIEYMGLVRMNAAGEIIWKLPYRTHHSVHRDESGNFWVCGLKWIEDTPEGRERLKRFPGLKTPVAEDFALKVSGDGKILKEISILEALYKSGYKQLLWRMRSDQSGDILHTNDVEPLRSDMADQYALFDAGDIVVSSRHINSIFVIDPDTEKIKWMCSSFLRQHDPDFVGNGWIWVFDNNVNSPAHGSYLGGTRILRVRPQDNSPSAVYPKTKEQTFFTSAGGKMQHLGNGNLLITEARRGRVFEVDESGKTVWEWVHERYDDDLVAEVLEGTRYAFTPDQIAAWTSK
jgi:hypothetical protein